MVSKVSTCWGTGTLWDAINIHFGDIFAFYLYGMMLWKPLKLSLNYMPMV